MARVIVSCVMVCFLVGITNSVGTVRANSTPNTVIVLFDISGSLQDQRDTRIGFLRFLERYIASNYEDISINAYVFGRGEEINDLSMLDGNQVQSLTDSIGTPTDETETHLSPILNKLKEAYSTCEPSQCKVLVFTDAIIRDGNTLDEELLNEIDSQFDVGFATFHVNPRSKDNVDDINDLVSAFRAYRNINFLRFSPTVTVKPVFENGQAKAVQSESGSLDDFDFGEGVVSKSELYKRLLFHLGIEREFVQSFDLLEVADYLDTVLDAATIKYICFTVISDESSNQIREYLTQFSIEFVDFSEPICSSIEALQLAATDGEALLRVRIDSVEISSDGFDDEANQLSLMDIEIKEHLESDERLTLIVNVDSENISNLELNLISSNEEEAPFTYFSESDDYRVVIESPDEAGYYSYEIFEENALVKEETIYLLMKESLEEDEDEMDPFTIYERIVVYRSYTGILDKIEYEGESGNFYQEDAVEICGDEIELCVLPKEEFEEVITDGSRLEVVTNSQRVFKIYDVLLFLGFVAIFVSAGLNFFPKKSISEAVDSSQEYLEKPALLNLKASSNDIDLDNLRSNLRQKPADHESELVDDMAQEVFEYIFPFNTNHD